MQLSQQLTLDESSLGVHRAIESCHRLSNDWVSKANDAAYFTLCSRKFVRYAYNMQKRFSSIWPRLKSFELRLRSFKISKLESTSSCWLKCGWMTRYIMKYLGEWTVTVTGQTMSWFKLRSRCQHVHLSDECAGAFNPRVGSISQHDACHVKTRIVALVEPDVLLRIARISNATSSRRWIQMFLISVCFRAWHGWT